MKPEGEVEVAIGTLSSGQGHETSFAQCVGEWLAVPFEQVKLVQGDTDIVPVGGGSHSGRSMRMAGFVMGKAADAVLVRARAIAAHMLKAEPGRVTFVEGRFRAADGGADGRVFNLFEIARAAQTLNDLDDALRGPLAGECDHTFTDAGFPYGCAVCEVEIDPETGVTEIVRYSSVDDVGRAINPMILHGQTHGAIAQGVGQAMWEQCVVDPQSGGVMTGSPDYAMARRHFAVVCDRAEVPSPTRSAPAVAAHAGARRRHHRRGGRCLGRIGVTQLTCRRRPARGGRSREGAEHRQIARHVPDAVARSAA